MALSAIKTAVRNKGADAIVDEIDVGTTDAAGALNGYTSSHASLLFECACSNPAAGAASSGTATLNAITADSSANNTGTAAAGRVQDRDNATVCDFTIGTSSQDLNLNTTSITSGDNVSITSASFSQPAS